MRFIATFTLFIGLIAFSGASMKIASTWLSGSGKVSWYGDRFHGKLTASGEKYDMHDFTAAHKTLPFGTKVKITNPNNGKSVIVEINDRGPYVKTRQFDLSRAAFAEIGNIDSGVISIEYEIVN
ncbi:MAG: septal ring lytic transglycosylase RlpA family protein [Weeksellaceae bacterium]|jgi:rare lipoprotein A|nr:septal ring lytic transglycosylase RlpA family protein [Weeksellaceae bacterium]MDX9705346.1 septal ring lytic transglycosylase RlpA family protein [Weeksellaceae bacterium]